MDNSPAIAVLLLLFWGSGLVWLSVFRALVDGRDIVPGDRPPCSATPPAAVSSSAITRASPEESLAAPGEPDSPPTASILPANDGGRIDTGAPLLLFLGLMLLPVLLLSAIAPRERVSLEFVQTLCAIQTLQWVAGVVIWRYWQPMFLVELHDPFPTQWAELQLAGRAFLAALLPVFAVNFVVQGLGFRDPEKQHLLFQFLKAFPSATAMAWVVLTAVFLAPLVEELLFRVILQNWLTRKLGASRAVPLVAIAFALMHWSPGRPDHWPLLPLALILGYVYERRRRYLTCVAVHALFNACNLALAFAAR